MRTGVLGPVGDGQGNGDDGGGGDVDDGGGGFDGRKDDLPCSR